MAVPGVVPAQKEPQLSEDALLLPAVCALASGQADEMPGIRCQNAKPLHCFAADPHSPRGLAKNQPWQGGQLPRAAQEGRERCWLLEGGSSKSFTASGLPQGQEAPVCAAAQGCILQLSGWGCSLPSPVGLRTLLHPTGQ